MKKTIILLSAVGILISIAMANVAAGQPKAILDVFQGLNRRGAPIRVCPDGYGQCGEAVVKEVKKTSEESLDLPWIDYWQGSYYNVNSGYWEWELDFFVSYTFPESKVEVLWEGELVATRFPEKVKINKKSSARWRTDDWRSIFGVIEFDGAKRKGVAEVSISPKSGRPYHLYVEVGIPEFDAFLNYISCPPVGRYNALTLIYAFRGLYGLTIKEGTQATVCAGPVCMEGKLSSDCGGENWLEVVLDFSQFKKILEAQKNEGVYTSFWIDGMSYGRYQYYWDPSPWMTCSSP